MPSAMPARAMARCRSRIMNGQWNRKRGSISQTRGERQHQRRNNAESEERVERRQHAAQVARQIRGKLPGNRSSGKPAKRGSRARPGSNFQPRAAFRTLHIVRARHGNRRGNLRLAMRTHANGHGSPPFKSTYNNRNRLTMKREDGYRKSGVGA